MHYLISNLANILPGQELSGKNVLLLPMGCGNDGAHAQNEKIDIRNYIEGVSKISLLIYEFKIM